MQFFFLHNPKAGGSALRSFLANAGAETGIAPVFGNAPNEYAAMKDGLADFAGYGHYFGHYGFEVYRAIGRPDHALITNFRDPVRRIHSLYRYWRNNVDPAALGGLHPRDAAVVQSAQALPFADFIRQDSTELRVYTHNFHARQFHCDGWRMEVLDALALEGIKHRISAMPWFYIAESPEVSLHLFRKVFGIGADRSIARENLTTGPIEAISAADVDYITAHNRHDYAIYAHAWREQAERLATPRELYAAAG